MMYHGVRAQMILTVEMTNHALCIHILYNLCSVMKTENVVNGDEPDSDAEASDDELWSKDSDDLDCRDD